MALFKHLQPHTKALDNITLSSMMSRAKKLFLAVWAKTSRRMRIAGGLLLFLALATWLSLPAIRSINLPNISLEYHYKQQATTFNESKVALLIENRATPILAPLMLHFISVVPPDWHFRFMGTVESVQKVNQSVAIQEHVASGKLSLTYIPSNMTTGSQEEISQFLTTLWLYEVVLQPAEWLLIFQTDSILCANSKQNLNQYLNYDWVGAPWNVNGRFGGNGGLSMRRVSSIIKVLRNQQRLPNSDPEDVWLSERLGHLPDARLANGTIASTFSGEMHTGENEHIEHDKTHGNKTLKGAAANGTYVEGIDDYRDGYYEPMGYHTGGSGKFLHSPLWGTPALRRHIYEYCPEIKMTLKMDVAKFIPGSCGQNWKRWDMGETGIGAEAGDASDVDLGFGTEIIDGQEYPLLPESLVPW